MQQISSEYLYLPGTVLGPRETDKPNKVTSSHGVYGQEAGRQETRKQKSFHMHTHAHARVRTRTQTQ